MPIRLERGAIWLDAVKSNMNASFCGMTRVNALFGLLLFLPLVMSGCCGVSPTSHHEQPDVRIHPNLIAHVRHNGVSF